MLRMVAAQDSPTSAALGPSHTGIGLYARLAQSSVQAGEAQVLLSRAGAVDPAWIRPLDDAEVSRQPTVLRRDGENVVFGPGATAVAPPLGQRSNAGGGRSE